MNRRCCARCRTPYNCGNPSCICHARANPSAVRAWQASSQEPKPAERYALAHLPQLADDESEQTHA